MLGHDEPSPDAAHLFRRCGPIWLTFAAAHAMAARARRAARLVGAGLAARHRDRHRRALGGVAGGQPPRRQARPAPRRRREPGDGRRLRLAVSEVARWRTSPGCPDKRWSLRGTDGRGRRGLADPRHLAQALPLPGLPRRDRDRQPSTPIVQYVLRLGGTEHHHWHRRCAEEMLIPELREAEAGAGRRVLAVEARGAGPPAVGPARAADVNRRAELASIYARIGRTYLSWARSLLPLARDRLRAARAGPRDPGPGRDRLASTSTA